MQAGVTEDLCDVKNKKRVYIYIGNHKKDKNEYVLSAAVSLEHICVCFLKMNIRHRIRILAFDVLCLVLLGRCVFRSALFVVFVCVL